MARKAGSPTETSPLIPKPDPGLRSELSDETDSVDTSLDSHESIDGDVESRPVPDDDGSHIKDMEDVRKQIKYIFPAIALGVFLASADQTIIISSYGIIGTDLNALNKTSWIATSYLLTITSFQPLYGRLSDIFGRKACLLFAYFVFGLGCLFCGLARNINELALARALAGIGGGGMTTTATILLSDAVPLRERGKWQGYINLVYGAGNAAGAPLGGFMAESVGWRWIFNIQPILCLVSMLIVGLILDLPKQGTGNWASKLRRVDFAGAITLVLSVLSLLIALDRGSNVAWKDKWTLVFLSISIPLFLLYVLVEARIAAEPLTPGHIISDRSLFATYLCNFFTIGGWHAALFHLPLYFQAVDGLSATQASLRLLPCVIPGVAGSLFGGYYMHRTGKYYYLIVSNTLVETAGLLVIFLFTGVVGNSQAAIVIGMCLASWGTSVAVTSSLVAMIANCAQKDQAVVTACSYLFRSLGGVLAVSFSATAFDTALKKNLQETLGSGKEAAKIAERVRHSLTYIRHLNPDVKGIVIYCYELSGRVSFGLQLGLTIGAFISAWFIREKSLSR